MAWAPNLRAPPGFGMTAGQALPRRPEVFAMSESEGEFPNHVFATAHLPNGFFETEVPLAEAPSTDLDDDIRVAAAESFMVDAGLCSAGLGNRTQ